MSIQDELAAVQASGGGQDALNQWLATTSYTPSELSAATGYGVTDITNAINSANMAVNPYTFTNTSLASDAAQYHWSPEYAKTQDDLASTRAMMSAYNLPYVVTGNASAANLADSTAYLPAMMNAAGIPITQGILDRYQALTGQSYTPGTAVLGYDPTTNKYTVGSGAGLSQTGLMGLASAGTPTTSTQASTQTTTPPSSGSTSFGSGAAHTGFSSDQINTIKGTWQQYLAGQKTKAEIQQAMTQYGVNFADISAATGIPVSTLLQQFNGSGSGAISPSPSTPPSPQQPANFGSPYNPANVTPNPDGSGTPYGSTHPASGMVSLNSGGDYNETMKNYYNAYFGGGGAPDQGMLNSWYSTPYNPAPTGFSTANKGASSASGLVNSLQWGKPEWDAVSTPKLYQYMNMYGLSAADVGKALGFSEQQIIDHFKKYNIDVTKTNTTGNS